MLLSHLEYSFLFLDALPFLSFLEDRWTSKMGNNQVLQQKTSKTCDACKARKVRCRGQFGLISDLLGKPFNSFSAEPENVVSQACISCAVRYRVTAQPAFREFYSMLNLQKKRGLCCHFSFNKRRVRPSQANSPKNANGKKTVTIKSIMYFPSSQ